MGLEMTRSYLETLSLKVLWDIHMNLEETVSKEYVELEGKRARKTNIERIGRGRGIP